MAKTIEGRSPVGDTFSYRREEFAAFGWEQDVPDPQDEQTYGRSHLDHSLKEAAEHKTLFRFYRQLIRIRRDFRLGSAEWHTVRELDDHALLLFFNINPNCLAILLNFAEFPVTLRMPNLGGNWAVRLDSADECWNRFDTNRDNGDDRAGSKSSREREGFDACITAATEFRLRARSFLVLEQSGPVETK